MGRTSKLTAEVVTTCEQVIRTGGFMEEAAAKAGVSKQTLYTWLREAARLAGKHGRRNAHERLAIDLAERLDRAEAAWITETWLIHGQLARSSTTTTTRTESTYGPAPAEQEPPLLERKVVEVQVAKADLRALEWRMARRHPRKFSQRVELTGADGGPVELDTTAKAQQAADQLRQYQQR